MGRQRKYSKYLLQRFSFIFTFPREILLQMASKEFRTRTAFFLLEHDSNGEICRSDFSVTQDRNDNQGLYDQKSQDDDVSSQKTDRNTDQETRLNTRCEYQGFGSYVGGKFQLAHCLADSLLNPKQRVRGKR